jgi:hypothetical protein
VSTIKIGATDFQETSVKHKSCLTKCTSGNLNVVYRTGEVQGILKPGGILARLGSK